MAPARTTRPLLAALLLSATLLAGCTFEEIPEGWTPPRDFTPPTPRGLDLRWENVTEPVTVGPEPVILTLVADPGPAAHNRTLLFTWSVRNATTGVYEAPNGRNLTVQFTPPAPRLTENETREIAVILRSQDAPGNGVILRIEAKARGEIPARTLASAEVELCLC